MAKSSKHEKHREILRLKKPLMELSVVAETLQKLIEDNIDGNLR